MGKDRVACAFGIGKAKGQGLDLVMGEGDGGEVEAGTQKIADPGFAFDGKARGLQMRDVAVDRAGADLEPPRHVLGPADAMGAQVLHQPEQSFSTANLGSPFDMSRPPA